MQLSREELTALFDYAAGHGRYWKRNLADDWMNGRTVGTLQYLRNASYFGPAGLEKCSLKGICAALQRCVYEGEKHGEVHSA